MKKIVQPWIETGSPPPACKPVMYCSWTRFAASRANKSAEELRVSVLCAAKGTTSDYNPPLFERMWTEPESPQQRTGCRPPQAKEVSKEQWVKKIVRPRSADSWIIEGESDGSPADLDPMTFQKQPIEKTNSSVSLLAEVFKTGRPQTPTLRKGLSLSEWLKSELESEKLDASSLPSAISSSLDDGSFVLGSLLSANPGKTSVETSPCHSSEYVEKALWPWQQY